MNIDVIKEQYYELTSQSRICFNLFYERLKKYLPEPEYVAAKKILYHMARKILHFEDIYPQVEDFIDTLASEAGQSDIDYTLLNTSLPLDKALLTYLSKRKQLF